MRRHVLSVLAVLVVALIIGTGLYVKVAHAPGSGDLVHIPDETLSAPIAASEIYSAQTAPAPVRPDNEAAEKEAPQVTPPGNPTFSGIVANMDGGPVPDATVTLLPPREDHVENLISRLTPHDLQKAAGTATSDLAGRFAVRDVLPGLYAVVAAHSLYVKTIQYGVQVTQGQDVGDFRIVLGSGGSIDGRYAIGGKPQEGATIQIMGGGDSRMTTTDKKGRFGADHLTSGPYMLTVVDKARLSAKRLKAAFQMTPHVVDVSEGANVHVDLSPDDGVTVSGKLIGKKTDTMLAVWLRRPGGPAPDQVHRADLNEIINAFRFLAGQAFAAPDGSFRLDGIPPGDYILEVYSFTFDPANPDLGSLAEMDRRPRWQEPLTVGDKAATLKIALPND